MIQDTYISNNIISYLNIHEKIFINKFHYNESKISLKSKINIIERFYLKNKLRLEMLFEYFDDENLQAIRNYYILFYPKEYRPDLFEQVIRFRSRDLSNNQYINIINLAEQCIINKDYNKGFKQLINQLQLSDLAFLGW